MKNLQPLRKAEIVLRGNRMKKKQSKAIGVHNNKDFDKNDRIEWLQQLYAEWLEKRNFILNNDKQIYHILEPEELDTEAYWEEMSKELPKVVNTELMTQKE